MANINRWSYLCFLLLLFIVAPGYANDDIIYSDIFSSQSTYEGTDVALNLLGQIVGHIPGVLPGTGPGVLPVLFSIFNAGVLAIGSALAMYAITISILKTASDGEALGRGVSKIGMPLKLSIGLALALPIVGNGLNTMQLFVTWISVQGVNIANNMWSAAVDYVIQEGTIRPVRVGEGDVDDVVANLAELSKLQICMAAVERYYNHNNRDSQDIRLRSTPLPTGSINGQFKISFPSSDLPPQIPSGVLKEGDCGYAYVQLNSGNQREFTTKVEAYNQMLRETERFGRLVAAERIVPPQRPSPQVLKLAAKNMAELEALGILQGTRGLMAQRNEVDYTAAQEQLQKSKAAGFMAMPGTYRWLIDSTDRASENNVASYLPKTDFKLPENGYPGRALYPDQWRHVYNESRYLESKDGQDALKDAKTAITNMRASMQDRSKAMGLNLDLGQLSHSGAEVLTLGMLTVFRNKFDTHFNTFDSNNNPIDPIAATVKFGRSLVETSIEMYGGLIAGTTVASIPGAVGGLGWNLSAQVIANITSVLLPIFIAAAGFMLTAGLLLAYAVPFIPAMVMYSAMLAWFFIVIEMLAAAPIVAVAIAHPEGHEWCGGAHPAVRIFLQALSYPALMVIGFIAAILTTYVGLQLFHHWIFIPVVQSLIGPKLSTMGGSGDAGNIFALYMFLFMYVYAVVYMVIYPCFKWVNDAPRAIFGYIGGGHSPMGGSVAQSHEGFMGAANQAGQQFGRQMEGNVQNTSKAAGETGKSVSKYRDGKEAQKPESGGG